MPATDRKLKRSKLSENEAQTSPKMVLETRGHIINGWKQKSKHRDHTEQTEHCL